MTNKFKFVGYDYSKTLKRFQTTYKIKNIEIQQAN